jgi:sialic acid synthase SpsE
MLIMSDNVYIIAEIGINHEGDVEKCREMIYSAAESGANAVKLQTIDANANYVVGSESYKVFKGSELTREETANMFDLARENGLDVFTTVGDIGTAEWVEKLEPSCWKISSGLLTHIPMVRHLASLGRPLLISTGMANVDDINLAIETSQSAGNNDISLFQCTSLYPAPLDSLNLSTIGWLKERYGYDVGFSDHSLGSDAAFLSVGAGSTLIEKHFSLDPGQPGFDHKISLNIVGFKEMVERVRVAEKMMGMMQKEVSEAVNNTRMKYLRSVVAIRSIMAGQKLSGENIGIKRTLPGNLGLAPKYFESIIGSIATIDIEVDQSIRQTDFKSNQDPTMEVL